MPPKKQKKQPHNPFYFFMMDWKKKQLEMGCSVPGALNLLAEAATPDWKSLSETDKEPYKLKAKVAKEEDKNNLHNKFTTEGKSYAQVYAEQKEVEDFNATMEREIKDTIKKISQDWKSLVSHKFYLIHANHYCYWSPKNLYIPCEVAVAEYSIEHGVTNTLHFFPTVIATDDGRLPVGYLHEAQEIARRSHCVPLPPIAHAESYDLMSAKLLSFLQKQSGTSKIPPLYTMENNLNCNYSMSTVKDFLAHCEDYCEVSFRTYRLDMMFFELRNACADFAIREEIDLNATGFPSISIAQMELDRDIYHFTRGISCKYHEDMDSEQSEYEDHQVTQFCSLSTVNRWCFLVSDFCCQDVGVNLIRGRHCPRNADTSYGEVQVATATESRGFGAPAPSTSTKKPAQKQQYVDAPPPAVNSWGKGPPKMDAEPKEEPKTGAISRSTEKAKAAKGAAPQTPVAGQSGETGSTWKVNGKVAASPQPVSAEANDFPALENFRLPKTRGRGERLLAAINRVQLNADKEDFPALGAGRGRGRF